ncbi:stage V sporulation protein E [Candidatus Kaiserbacteria bacterium CG10_big_fil_rev_8_21_14_0_10_49_17]|uniref:Probable peptidoglycan glycosyltransferase FtsW n=1 Tax=Candidatus Kaiserbacteria bacterium CG10_big_fil_rev_8_21_14_0_10_49_17 TaxID=1974609 RepID=A0A2M6WF21_9BACT|nr:MAG: stage V sporulation protein E [Candidatus Kaiserbacteria bacterium CG10_big_fil_rev_8_21_14_0_10_49_17]
MKVDTPLFIITLLLVVVGFFIFTSASLGLLARDGARFSSVAFSQVGLGMALGTVLLITLSRIRYRLLRPYALFFFIGALVLTLLVFIPGLGRSANGATRWLEIGLFSIQPSEFLKLAYVIYLASFLAGAHRHIHDSRYSVLPFLGITGATAITLILQPDTSTILVILCAGFAMLIAAGAKVRDLAITALVPLTALAALVIWKPYIRERLLTFLNPLSDQLGAGYQIKQSLIAVGSGEWFGRGFGQSVQKFNYLPEPIGDSIFAVFAEEFGFIGAMLLIGVFLAFAFRGLRIASRAPDYFGGLLVVGIVILIISQSFINIASMLGVMPLTGLPLVFISHGGTALASALAGVGIVLNVSKYTRS